VYDHLDPQARAPLGKKPLLTRNAARPAHVRLADRRHHLAYRSSKLGMFRPNVRPALGPQHDLPVVRIKRRREHASMFACAPRPDNPLLEPCL